ncbi:MAG: HAMP domain-containing histidine kinase, partial [Verrucomicrobia bacterium]|nr:HAMP domain-containing histidine kinase [Verrucomicrobiota bacterium]
VVQDELLRALQALSPENLEQALRIWEQDNPLVRNVFIWQGANDLLLPDSTLPLTREQREFLQRYNTLFNGSRSWEEANGQEDATPSTSQKLYVRMKGRQPQLRGTWIPWYWENRFGMIGWTQKESGGPRYGVELEMIAMLSEMVAVLPPMPDNRLMALVDGTGHRIYQSGGLEISEELNPALRIPVGRVLPHWEMVLYTPDGTFAGDAPGYALLSGLLVGFLFLALFVSSGLLLRDAHRNRLDARQKTTFVSNVSHELKTPLTTIRMYADLLGEGRVTNPEKAKRYLHTIVGESERLTRLVNNVLDFSRLEQNRKKYRITKFNLREAVEETFQSQSLRIQNANMDLMVSLPPDPAPIKTDRDALRQVLLNLVDNAIKYAADGGKLSVELTFAPGGYFIAVADAGPGIPKKHRRRIFERFYRIDDSITATTQGCGLGLGIARRLLADLGADIEYQPAQGGGARFIITLPKEAP